MRQAVGPLMGVKASGGIRDAKAAEAMIKAGATRLGTSASVAIVTDKAAGEGLTEMAKKQPVKFSLRVDIQCGACGSLSHMAEGGFPKFCPCCGAAMERFCLHCQKKAEMFFEEWWPQDDECLRTYSRPSAAAAATRSWRCPMTTGPRTNGSIKTRGKSWQRQERLWVWWRRRVSWA